MASAIEEIFKFLLAPGIVAAIVTFALNTRDERHRTAREFQTKFVDETRADVRNAVNAGVAYFSNKDNDKVALLYAAVLLYERDVRQNIAAIRDSCDGAEKILASQLEILESDFLEYLTGGDFGPSDAVDDPARISRIVGQGSLLRGKLSELRRQQLNSAKNMMAHAIFTLLGLFALVVIGISYGLWLGVNF